MGGGEGGGEGVEAEGKGNEMKREEKVFEHVEGE